MMIWELRMKLYPLVKGEGREHDLFCGIYTRTEPLIDFCENHVTLAVVSEIEWFWDNSVTRRTLVGRGNYNTRLPFNRNYRMFYIATQREVELPYVVPFEGVYDEKVLHFWDDWRVNSWHHSPDIQKPMNDRWYAVFDRDKWVLWSCSHTKRWDLRVCNFKDKSWDYVCTVLESDDPMEFHNKYAHLEKAYADG